MNSIIILFYSVSIIIINMVWIVNTLPVSLIERYKNIQNEIKLHNNTPSSSLLQSSHGSSISKMVNTANIIIKQPKFNNKLDDMEDTSTNDNNNNNRYSNGFLYVSRPLMKSTPTSSSPQLFSTSQMLENKLNQKLDDMPTDAMAMGTSQMTTTINQLNSSTSLTEFMMPTTITMNTKMMTVPIESTTEAINLSITEAEKMEITEMQPLLEMETTTSVVSQSSPSSSPASQMSTTSLLPSSSSSLSSTTPITSSTTTTKLMVNNEIAQTTSEQIKSSTTEMMNPSQTMSTVSMMPTTTSENTPHPVTIMVHVITDETTEMPTTVMSTTMGSTTMGSATMGSTTIGSATIGSTTIGSTTMGSTAMGPTTMGSATIGSATMGSTTMGLTTMGSSTMGSTTMGSTTMGSSTMGSTTMGSTTIGSAMMGSMSMMSTTMESIAMMPTTMEPIATTSTTMMPTTIISTTMIPPPTTTTTAAMSSSLSTNPQTTMIDQPMTTTTNQVMETTTLPTTMPKIPITQPLSTIITSSITADESTTTTMSNEIPMASELIETTMLQPQLQIMTTMPDMLAITTTMRPPPPLPTIPTITTMSNEIPMPSENLENSITPLIPLNLVMESVATFLPTTMPSVTVTQIPSSLSSLTQTTQSNQMQISTIMENTNVPPTTTVDPKIMIVSASTMHDPPTSSIMNMKPSSAIEHEPTTIVFSTASSTSKPIMATQITLTNKMNQMADENNNEAAAKGSASKKIAQFVLIIISIFFPLFLAH